MIDQWAPGTGVQLDLHSTIPEGVGAGSSTADCAATVAAVRALLGVPPSARTHVFDVVADVYAAEGPCDPLILLDAASTLLWGSRSGTLLKRYDVPLPAFQAVGFITEPGRTVSTVDLAARQIRYPPTAGDIDAFAVILRDFERALAAGSRAAIARAATTSGALNQSRCAIDHWEELVRLAETVGALGLACAHSGTAAAFLFDPDAADLSDRCDHAIRRLYEFRVAQVHQFRTDAIPKRWSATHELRIQTMNDHTQVHEYVQAQGLSARLIAPRTPMPTVPLAAAALGVAEGQIVKTIVFECKKAPGIVAVAIVTGDARVDRARVAAVLSLPTLKLASPETVSSVIGYEVGGVPPVAHLSSVPVVVDRRVLEHEKVYGGGGDDFHMLEIAPQDIVRLTQAVIADVTLIVDAAPAAS